MKGSVTYQLPFGHGRRFLANKGKFVNGLLSGWRVNGIVLYVSGTPLQITDSNPAPASNLYFPASIAANPDYGDLGTGPARIDALRGFGIKSENVSLMKDTSRPRQDQFGVRFEF